jgi:hypothetical protein
MDKLKWWEEIYYPVYRFFNYNFHLRWFKWMYEYVRYGFSSRQLWSLDRTCTDFILPRLKAFRNGMGGGKKNGCEGPTGCPKIDGYPFVTNDQDSHDAMYAEWLRILDVMIEGFTYHQLDGEDLDFGGFEMTTTPCEENGYRKLHINHVDEKKYQAARAEELRRDKVIEEALAYFAKYYRNIWDAITICIVPTLTLGVSIFI